MRDVDNSDEYELVSKEELDELRKEVESIKNNPFGSTHEGKTLLEAIEDLNSSIHKFIAILEDAEKDIIEEYQNSKPAEKLNQVLDQNEKIARALISINDNVQRAIPQQPQQISAPMTTMQPQQQMQQRPMQQPMQFHQQMQNNLPSLDNMPLPPLDASSLPPLGNNLPNFAPQPPKRKGLFG